MVGELVLVANAISWNYGQLTHTETDKYYLNTAGTKDKLPHGVFLVELLTHN